MSEDSGQQPGQPQEQAGPGQQPGPVPPSYPPTPPAYPAPGANPYAAGYTPPPPGWTPQQPGVAAFPTYVLPDLPKATTALVLGIIAVAGGFMCILPVLVAPVAWILGAQARKEIRAAPQQWGGDGRATAGMVLGIIGTVLLLLVVLVVVIVIVVAVNDPNAFEPDTSV